MTDAGIEQDFEKSVQDLALGDIEVAEFSFDLSKGSNGFGIACRKSSKDFIGVRIVKIASDSPAAGILKIYDQILMVDDKSLISADLSDDEALSLVESSLSKNKALKLAVGRPRPESDVDEWERELFASGMYKGSRYTAPQPGHELDVNLSDVTARFLAGLQSPRSPALTSTPNISSTTPQGGGRLNSSFGSMKDGSIDQDFDGSFRKTFISPSKSTLPAPKVMPSATSKATVTVTGKDTATVTGKATVTVTGKDTATVTGKDTATVTGKDTATVTGKDTVTVTSKHTVIVTGKDTVTVTGKDTVTGYAIPLTKEAKEAALNSWRTMRSSSIHTDSQQNNDFKLTPHSQEAAKSPNNNQDNKVIVDSVPPIASGSNSPTKPQLPSISRVDRIKLLLENKVQSCNNAPSSSSTTGPRPSLPHPVNSDGSVSTVVAALHTKPGDVLFPSHTSSATNSQTTSSSNSKSTSNNPSLPIIQASLPSSSVPKPRPPVAARKKDIVLTTASPQLSSETLLDTTKVSKPIESEIVSSVSAGEPSLTSSNIAKKQEPAAHLQVTTAQPSPRVSLDYSVVLGAMPISSHEVHNDSNTRSSVAPSLPPLPPAPLSISPPPLPPLPRSIGKVTTSPPPPLPPPPRIAVSPSLPPLPPPPSQAHLMASSSSQSESIDEELNSPALPPPPQMPPRDFTIQIPPDSPTKPSRPSTPTEYSIHSATSAAAVVHPPVSPWTRLRAPVSNEGPIVLKVVSEVPSILSTRSRPSAVTSPVPGHDQDDDNVVPPPPKSRLLSHPHGTASNPSGIDISSILGSLNSLLENDSEFSRHSSSSRQSSFV